MYLKVTISQRVSIRSPSSWLLSHLNLIQKCISRWLLAQLFTFSGPGNHMTSQIKWECPSVTTRTFALFSKTLTDHTATPVFCLGNTHNLCVSLPPLFSRTAHQKQVISELSNALLTMMSSTLASFMNGFLCLMTQTTPVHSNARPKEQPWLLN